jgi:hypothetical protein
LYKDQKVSLDLEEQTKNVSMPEENEETFTFSTLNLKTQQTYLKINDYIIPIFLTRKISPPQKFKQLIFYPEQIKGVIFSGKDYYFTIIIENSGDENITNITFSNDFKGTIQPPYISIISPEEKVSINLTLSSENTKNNLSGEIISNYEDSQFIIPVYFETTENKTLVNISISGIDTNNTNQQLSCVFLGNICAEDQDCSGETVPSLEGPCCKGECTSTTTSNYSWIYGALLLLAVAGIIIYLFWKVRSRQRPKSEKEILQENYKKYKERMSGNSVEGQLDRT